jgi:phenylacetate-CoA ligase
MSSFENIYHQMPVFLQNIALSIYGLYVKKIRHGQKYKDYLRQIEDHMTFSNEDLLMFQWDAFIDQLAVCKKHVPYYRNALKDVPVKEIRSIEDMHKLPFLEKDVIRSAPESLVDDRFKKKKMLVFHTTGTTGTPLKVFCNQEIRKINYAFYTRYLKQVGIDYHSKRATFGSRVVVPYTQEDPPFWRFNYLNNNIIYSSYHLTQKNISSYIFSLKKNQPDYIDSYPSCLYTIVKFARSEGLSLKGITRAITTSSETLFFDQRSVIEDAFGVKIFDQYGSTEMCVFVGECSHGSYHVHSDYGITEFLREDGSPALPGEEAEIVCTSLINYAMPLVRYRIGDRAVLSEKRCECGSHFPVVAKIIGRKDDVILTPDGRRVGRLGSVVKGLPVREAQYLQKNIDEISVIIVKDQGFTLETEKSILLSLRRRVGGEIKLNIKYVDNIERANGGKFRSIISEL